jgi:glycosyltransferase involved in cell wall biosynthesis
MVKPGISVVVPVFNSAEYLRQSVESILEAIAQYGPAELILIDNGSIDGSYELLLSRYAQRSKVEQRRGLTISALRNYGATLGTGEFISFIDSDCLVSQDYFDNVADVFSLVETDVAGCMYALPAAPHWIEKTWQELHEHPKDGFVHFLNSGNFAIKRSAFERSGGFDETLVTGEDAEFCQRLVTGGFRIYESRRIAAVHLGNPKTVPSFVRKHIWHGLGMFGTFANSWLDKPLLMTFVFILSTLAGVAVLFLRSLAPVTKVGLLIGCSLSAPTATVAYRAVARRSLRNPLRSLFLYWLYYASRTYSLFLIALRLGRRARVTR